MSLQANRAVVNGHRNRAGAFLFVIGCTAFVAVAHVHARAAAAPADPLAQKLAEQAVFRQVVSQVKPFLVRIETVGGAQPPDVVPTGEDDELTPQKRRLQNEFRDNPGSSFTLADGPTTGIIFSSDGYIVTSSFNFVREPILITATLPDGRRLPARLVGRDAVRKIALLKVEADQLPTPTWADAAQVRVGQWAIALGLAFGGDDPSVTVGIISAKNRMKGTAIQTDAKLSPANYGGPICDIDGRIVALATPMAQRPGELAGVDMYDAGVGFGLPTSTLGPIVSDLMQGKNYYRGWLGVRIGSMPGLGGLFIKQLADPSPLRTAGVKAGDRIIEINGVEMKHYGLLIKTIYMLPAGEEVALKLVRPQMVESLDPDTPPREIGTEEYEITVRLARNTELGSLPAEPEPQEPSHPNMPRFGH